MIEALRDWGLTAEAEAPPASKNRVLLAHDAGGTRFFVKAPPHPGDPGVGIEAEILQALNAAGAESVPRLRAVRSNPDVLAVEWVDRAETLHARHARDGFEPSLAQSVGRTLGELHRLLRAMPAPRASSTMADDFLDRFLRLSPDVYARMGSASVQLVGAVQFDEGILGALAELRRADGEATSLVHGDLRWPNVLATGERLLVIDWEAAGPGAPERDVGSIASEYVLAHALPRLAPRPLDEAGLAAVLAALRAGYEGEGGAAPLQWPLVVISSAEALLRAAYTLTEQRSGFDGRVRHLLGWASSLCEAPAAYAELFFGGSRG